jgi:hypothetical protein
MKDYKVLRFLDIFKKTFEKMEIDYKAMRRILAIKLLLDSRRVSTVLTNTKKSEKDRNNFVSSLGMYLLFGIFMIPFIILGDNFLFQMNIVFGMIMFILMTSLIADFSSVLLDLRDKEIILSKPVNARTLNMAKIIHIFIYIFMITMALSGPGLIASFIKHGLVFSLLFLAEIILIDLFSIVLTALIYIVVLRFFDGEKLKDIINYVQIGLTIVLTIGYQLISRAFQFIDLGNIVFTPRWWKYLLPPIWFAAPFEIFINDNIKTYLIVYSILAFIIPLISMLVYIKLIPSFERNLQKLNSGGNQKGNKNKLSDFLSNWACKSKEEKTFYRFATNMMKNERTFKLKVYPQLGFSVIFPFLMIISFNQGDNIGKVFSSSSYFGIYFIGIMVPTLLSYLKFSGNYKGAWIYKTIPITDTKAIYKGTMKAAFINLITPVFILVGILFLFIYKWGVIGDLIITYLSIMLYTRIGFIFVEKSLPFSRAFEVSEGGGNFVNTVASFLVNAALAAVHFFVKKIPYGLYIYSPVLIIVNIIAWNLGFDEK